MSANQTLLQEAMPTHSTAGLAAQRSSATIGGAIVPRRREARPALPDFDIDKGQLFRHERGLMSMLAPGA
jgi:hypothetical protein